jgi:hypothetical protein
VRLIRWIPVTERLPEIVSSDVEHEILACDKNGDVFGFPCWPGMKLDAFRITHWAEMPAGPDTEKQPWTAPQLHEGPAS